MPLYDRSTKMQAWIINYINYTVWDEITYSILNLNGATVEIWRWILNFPSHFSECDYLSMLKNFLSHPPWFPGVLKPVICQVLVKCYKKLKPICVRKKQPPELWHCWDNWFSQEQVKKHVNNCLSWSFHRKQLKTNTPAVCTLHATNKRHMGINVLKNWKLYLVPR